MSASLVRKSLGIVDPSLDNTGCSKKNKKKKGAFNIMPENQKLIIKSHKKAGKIKKTNVLSTSRKLTVADIRRNSKSKEQILQENLRKLELIKKASKVELNDSITKQIIERAVTKRPVQEEKKKKKVVKTAFTEEDFKRFEEEYVDE